MVLCLLPLSEEAPVKYLHVSMMRTVTSAKELDSVTLLLPLLGFLLYLFTQGLVCTGQALYPWATYLLNSVQESIYTAFASYTSMSGASDPLPLNTTTRQETQGVEAGK